MDKEQNRMGLYFNAKGSNLSSGTTEDLESLLFDIEYGEIVADDAVAEAIKVVLRERSGEPPLPPVIEQGGNDDSGKPPVLGS